MIIAHVLSSFHVGGQERMALELAGAQIARGHRVLAISLAGDAEGPLGAEFRALGATTFSVPKRGRGFDVRLPLRLSWLFSRERVDVVHTHNPQPLIYAAPAGKLARTALIHTKHGKNPVASRRRWLIRGAAALVDKYVAVAPTTARVALVNRECDKQKLAVIANGIDTDRFRKNPEAREALRGELGIPGDAWVIGTVGRLAPEKDQLLLLRAAAPLLHERCQLVLVGDGSERGALEAARNALPTGRFVHFVGPRSDVERWLSCFDVFALTSRTEGLPLVIPEAMAAELAVVSTAVGGIPDVLDSERTGILVPAGDEQGLRSAFARVMEHPNIARELGAHAQQVALQRYSRDRMAAEYMALYEAARPSRGSRTRALQPQST